MVFKAAENGNLIIFQLIETGIFVGHIQFSVF